LADVHRGIVVTEDDWPTTVRPRPEVARAELSEMQVIFITKGPRRAYLAA
jgi:hypothetical protein